MKNKIKQMVLAWRCASWEKRKEIRSSKFFQEKERDYYRAKDFYLEIA